MTSRAIIHIGVHRGTSAIQSALFRNRARLLRAGFVSCCTPNFSNIRSCIITIVWLIGSKQTQGLSKLRYFGGS